MGERESLILVLDHVDYTARRCRMNEMVGAVLPQEVIALAKQALREGTDDSEEKRP